MLVFTTPHLSNANINVESPMDDIALAEEEDELKLPNGRMVMGLLRRRALDDKVMVRKSALTVLENLMKNYKDMVNKENLQVLCQHCKDFALMIRKQSIGGLSGLAERYPDEVAEAWVTGVLQAIHDPEAKVQEKVLEAVHSLILGRLV